MLLTTIFFVGLSLNGASQPNTIDSLKLLETNTDEQGKLIIYNTLAEHYSHVNLDSAVYYGDKGLKLSKSLGLDNVHIVELLLFLSTNYTSNGNFTKGQLLLQQAEELCIVENDYELLAFVKIKTGEYYGHQGNYAEYLNSLNSALRIIDKKNIHNLKPDLYNKMGALYLRIDDIKYAKIFRIKAFENSINHKNTVGYISSLLLEGDIFLKLNKLDSCYICYNKALEIAKESNLKSEIQKTYKFIAKYWISEKDYGKAITNVDSSIIYCKKLGLTTELSSLITYKSHIYSNIGDVKKTLEYNLKSLKLREHSGNLKLICSSFLNIGGNYTELGDYKKAMYYLNEGIKIASAISSNLYLKYGYGKLAKLYILQDRYEEAFFYTKLNTQYNDSLLISKTSDRVLFYRNQYKLEKEIATSKSLTHEIRTSYIYFLIALLFISFVGIFFLIRANVLRKKALSEMRKLSTVVENMSQAVLIINTNGIITYVNNGLLKITNYPSDSYFINKSVFDFTNDNSAKQIRDEILPTLTKTGNWHGETHNKRYDGSFFITEEVCSVIKSKNGKPKYYVAIYNDITNRKKDELELKLSREKLKLAVETRDKMFSIIANDLTGPFGSILGFSKLMATEFHDYQTEDHERFSRLIYESSKTTYDLLTNLLNWSRAQLGSIELFTDNVNLNLLVDENIEALKLMISKRGISVKNKIPANFSASIDNDTISIVIKNLLTNAIKFSPHDTEIIVTSNKTSDFISITISDKGYGIRSEKMDNIFKVSVNELEVTNKDQKGAGLGLLLCKELVRLNGGTISARSEFGVGSDFTISFPNSNNNA